MNERVRKKERAPSGLAMIETLTEVSVHVPKKKCWLIGYVAPLAIIFAVAAGRRIPALEFIPMFSWLMHGRVEFVALGFVCALMGATLLRRISGKRAKVLLGVFMIIAILYLSALPFALPPVLRSYELNLGTNFDSYGVCLQSNHFNCGPAAAVTALKALGISAREGEIAVLAKTNPASGTQPDILCAALQKAYEQEGLRCEYRLFDSVEELKENTPAITLIKLNPVTDHHVAILEVNDTEVVVGDPLEGKRILSPAEFERVWRRSVIVLNRGQNRQEREHDTLFGTVSPEASRDRRHIA
jgi:predicted double-glycine peptidase